MKSYKAYLDAKQATARAAQWMANKDKIDSQCRQHYSLAKVSARFSYCGQSSAGANNYHDSPEGFNAEFERVLKRRFAQLSNEALAALQANERAALIACKGEIAAIQDEILEAESTPA